MSPLVLDKDQHKVVTEAYHEARNFGASPREMKALGEALWVESKARNLRYGDSTSLGALQQRPDQGWHHALNVKLAVRDFLTHARANRGVRGSAGALAQSVQRSAYPGRYDDVASVANQLQRLGGAGHAVTSSGGDNRGAYSLSTPVVRTVSKTVDDPEAARRVAFAQHLQRTNPGSLLLRLGAVDPAEPVTKTVQRSIVTGRPGSRDSAEFPIRASSNDGNDDSTNGVIKRLTERAATINAKQLPYKWGGGHAARVDPRSTGPLDCSGAVSAVLGVNPRVASQFTKWGSPGRGKRITVYAKGDHTLMEIDGHFFGTSGTNPGGGAGWIPRKAISKQYLAQFTARHPGGM